MVFDATFWATAALVVFLGLMIYLRIPGMVTRALDGRIKKIETDLAEADRLRADAKALLESYAQKRAEAEKEAEDIVLAAREEAFRLTGEASAALEQLVARRTRAVEDKIGQAEQQAVAEVRARAADLAVEAARSVLQKQMSQKSGALVDRAIADVAERLN